MLAEVLNDLDPTGAQIEDGVADVAVIIGETFLDHIAFVAKADDEVGKPKAL